MIVDVVIEDVFGMDIMNYINDQNLNTKAVVISGHDDFQYVRAMFILGAVEYLLKPIEQDQVEEAVLKAVSQMKIIEEEEKFTVDKHLNVCHRIISMVFYVNYFVLNLQTRHMKNL